MKKDVEEAFAWLWRICVVEEPDNEALRTIEDYIESLEKANKKLRRAGIRYK